MSEPVTFKVWDDDIEESHAGDVICHTAIGAMLYAIAELADDGTFADDLAEPNVIMSGPGFNIWEARAPDGSLVRAKLSWKDRTLSFRILDENETGWEA